MLTERLDDCYSKIMGKNSVMYSSERGQILLITVLVMIIALTVGLSVASRSITSLRISTEEENSVRAFSAAEAGIEQVLKSRTPITSPQTLTNEATIREVKLSKLQGTEFILNSGNLVEKNDGTDIWLIDHNSDGSLNYTSGWQGVAGAAALSIYWGADSNPCNNAAIEMTVLSGSGASQTISRYPFDPCAARQASNNFSLASLGSYSVGGKNFFNSATILITNGLLVRVVPIYFSTPFGVRGCDSAGANCNVLVNQGNVIESTGTSGTTQRKITVFQGFAELPSEVFPFVLFSTE